MNALKLITATRTSSTDVQVTYLHLETNSIINAIWNNLNPVTGEADYYDLQRNKVIAENENLDEVIDIAFEETDENSLYLELRDTFDAQDCVEMQTERYQNAN